MNSKGKVWGRSLRDADIQKAVEVLRQGGTILYPTDTIWGIGCDATNAEAVRKVFEIKQREDSKALICLVDSAGRLQRYVRDVPDVAWDIIDLATKPTTVILNGAVNLAPNLLAEDGSVGLRVTLRELPLPEGHRIHLREHQRAAVAADVCGHRPSHHQGGGLCVRVATARHQPPRTFCHHQAHALRRSYNY